MACTKESVYAWFDQFEAFLSEHGITSADQIYNCDESGFPLQTGTSMKVCCDRQIRRNFQIASNSKTSITTLQCICANGSIVPPAAIFPGVKFNPEYSFGFPTNFYLGFTKNGWMETPQFYAWLTNHFVKMIPAIRPVVLLVDGHASHINYHTSLLCSENNMLLFHFPPHTSHALQPTDRGYFSAFKSNLSKEVAKFTVEHAGVSITKRIFPTVFTRAYEISSRVDVVKSSFGVTGIWPVNRIKVDHDLFNPSNVYTEAPVDFARHDVNDYNAPEQTEEVDPTLEQLTLPSLNFSDISTIKSIQIDGGSITAPTTTEMPGSSSSCSNNVLLKDISAVIPSANMDTSIPGGSKTALGRSPLKASTPMPRKVHPVLQGLQDLEKGLGNKKHLFRNRLIENYDIKTDSLYQAWKTLHNDWEQIKEQIRTESFSKDSTLDDKINPVINSILKYPIIERKTASRKKKGYPKHTSGAEALQILQIEEKEKRRVDIVKEASRLKKMEKQKKSTATAANFTKSPAQNNMKCEGPLGLSKRKKNG